MLARVGGKGCRWYFELSLNLDEARAWILGREGAAAAVSDIWRGSSNLVMERRGRWNSLFGITFGQLFHCMFRLQGLAGLARSPDDISSRASTCLIAHRRIQKRCCR